MMEGKKKNMEGKKNEGKRKNPVQYVYQGICIL